MRLTEQQKDAVLFSATATNRDAVQPELVRVGSMWACVWREPTRAPAARWRGQLVKAVIPNAELADLGVERLDVWWTGFEHEDRTRRDVIAQLEAEALR